MSTQSESPTNPYDLSVIGRNTLTPPVRRLLDCPSAELSDWHYERVYGGVGEVSGNLSGVYPDSLRKRRFFSLGKRELLIRTKTH